MFPFPKVTLRKFVPSCMPSKIFIHVLKFSSKSNYSELARMKLKLMVLKAFSKSTNIIMPGGLFCLAEWKRSYIFLVHSEINLPKMYAFCLHPIKLSRTGLSQGAKTTVSDRVSGSIRKILMCVGIAAHIMQLVYNMV